MVFRAFGGSGLRGAREGGGHPGRVPAGDQRVHGGGVEEGEIAGGNQPGRAGMGLQGGEDAGQRPRDGGGVEQLRQGFEPRPPGLAGSAGKEDPAAAGGEQLEGADRLGLAVIGEQGLVLPHAHAFPAGQDEAVQDRRFGGGHGGQGIGEGSHGWSRGAANQSAGSRGGWLSREAASRGFGSR